MSDEPDGHFSPTLRRVAAALDVPVAALFADRKAAALWSGDPQSMQAEVGALLNAFLSLADPQARRRCIAAVEAEVRHAREAESTGTNPDGFGSK